MGAYLGVTAVDEPTGAPTETGPKSGRKTKSIVGTTNASEKHTEVADVTEVPDAAPPKSLVGNLSTHLSLVEQEEDEHIPQCGLEDEWDKLEVIVPPPRIKTSMLTPEETARFKGHLEKIFARECLLGQRIGFSTAETAEVLIKVITYLKTEPMLIEDVPYDITVVGDLRGQLYDLDRVFRADSKDGKPGWECMKYVFLGNYVESGARQSVEVVMALFCLKMLYPDNIFLLRGTNEFIDENMKNGFFRDIYGRYAPAPAEELFYQFNATFSHLSVAAIIGNVYFCSHSGVSPGCTRRLLQRIKKPYYFEDDDMIVFDIIHAEPAEGLRGTTSNPQPGKAYWYGFEPLAHFLASMEVVSVIRSHTMLAKGFEHNWNCAYTVFTATNWNEKNNVGAVIHVQANGKLEIRKFPVCPLRTEWERKLRRLASEIVEDVKKQGKEAVQH